MTFEGQKYVFCHMRTLRIAGVLVFALRESLQYKLCALISRNFWLERDVVQNVLVGM